MREWAVRMLAEGPLRAPARDCCAAARRGVAGDEHRDPAAVGPPGRGRRRHTAWRPFDEAEEIKRLKRENAELRRANEILKSPPVAFAKELDRPTAK